MHLKYKEIKRHLNKPDQTFICDLVHYEENHVILKYYSEDPGQISDIKIPPGSTTMAYYWSDRGYVLWQMFDNTGDLIGTLFHICSEVDISETEVHYLDLLLDIWITPDSSIRILDQDEVTEAHASGRLTAQQLFQIEKNKHLITNNHKTIINRLYRGRK